jgi:hypothetical protein
LPDAERADREVRRTLWPDCRKVRLRLAMALLLFCVVVFSNMMALVLDLLLYTCNVKTLTAYFSEEPERGIVAVAWQCVGVVALAYHLWVSR